MMPRSMRIIYFTVRRKYDILFLCSLLVPCTTLVPLSYPSNLFQIWEKTNEIKLYSWMYNILKESILFQIWYRLMRNNHIHECIYYIERIIIFHSKLPRRYQLSKKTNSQKLPYQRQKSRLHTHKCCSSALLIKTHGKRKTKE